jgi:NhaP-type Na+/H+ or K+/H+ antiporter
MGLLGFIFGLLLAALPIYLIGLLAGLLFKAKDPDERAMYAAIDAYLVAYVLAAFGFADEGPIRWSAGLLYIPAAVIAFMMLRRHYLRLWNAADTEGLEQTFE